MKISSREPGPLLTLTIVAVLAIAACGVAAIVVAHKDAPVALFTTPGAEHAGQIATQAKVIERR